MKKEHTPEQDEKLKKAIAIAAAVIVVVAALIGPTLKGESVTFKRVGQLQHPVRGIDVSEYQKRIEWDKVRTAGYDFAFIKATEGKDYVDSTFRENWKNAAKAGLARGAYHFYLFRRGGLEQARNFIATVPVEEASISPVIDVEMGGSNGKDPDVEAVRGEMGIFMDELEKQYGRRPIIYTNHTTYEKLIMGYFPDHPIWIADPDSAPVLADGRPWTFWQYTFEGSVDGITGLVDLNVFNNGDVGLEEAILKEKTAQ
jgi:lysozyme